MNGGLAMKEKVDELIKELQDLRQKQYYVSDQLANEVTKLPGVMEALEYGLVRLNFPAPPGFTRMLREKRINH